MPQNSKKALVVEFNQDWHPFLFYFFLGENILSAPRVKL